MDSRVQEAAQEGMVYWGSIYFTEVLCFVLFIVLVNNYLSTENSVMFQVWFSLLKSLVFHLIDQFLEK